MQAVLDKFADLGAAPLHTLTVDQARAQPTPADAVAAVMADQNMRAGPAADSATRDMTIPGPAGDIKARVYTPDGEGPFPVIVYYHGGGWVIADIDTYDASARALSLGTGAIVATVITAHIDPLGSESVACGAALQTAGGAVEMMNFVGVAHEFFGIGAVVPQAVEAMDFATTNLRAAFGN